MKDFKSLSFHLDHYLIVCSRRIELPSQEPQSWVLTIVRRVQSTRWDSNPHNSHFECDTYSSSITCRKKVPPQGLEPCPIDPESIVLPAKLQGNKIMSPNGIEPSTHALKGRCSNQLSYEPI